MSHFATPDFWYCYRNLPEQVRALADKNFALLRFLTTFSISHFSGLIVEPGSKFRMTWRSFLAWPGTTALKNNSFVAGT